MNPIESLREQARLLELGLRQAYLDHSYTAEDRRQLLDMAITTQVIHEHLTAMLIDGIKAETARMVECVRADQFDAVFGFLTRVNSNLAANYAP